ncbi:hypothetical protein CSB20_10880 [bacterium DOLZORAL124_64_63]|nr:MAG: hypothetical protein CSB20_10880 [bacterium DOLZORAL124_64_63]
MRNNVHGTPGNGTESGGAMDHTAHPLLDPHFAAERSRLLHLIRLSYRRMRQDDEAYRQELTRFFFPIGSQSNDMRLPQMLARASEYLREADIYLDATLDILPEERLGSVLPDQEVRDCHDVRDLMRISFDGPSTLKRFEARRKLFLAQTLLHIDQCRVIQDGPRHLSHFEEILNRGLWQHTRQIHDLTVGYRLGPDGHTIEYTSRPQPDHMLWDFRSTFLEKKHDGRNICLDVLYYNCRFKMAVAPLGYELIDGRHRVVEKTRFDRMRQQSAGSVLSKMIRKGINNPDEIGDLIGAMFIVPDTDSLNDLLSLLDACLGNSFGWRNVTDTLAKTRYGSALNTFSSKGFKVFKGDVDILFEEYGGGRPYRFPVEIQIFSLESYLRTVCGEHEANHLALKQRQFMFGVVPRMFPLEIYGEDWTSEDDKIENTD